MANSVTMLEILQRFHEIAAANGIDSRTPSATELVPLLDAKTQFITQLMRGRLVLVVVCESELQIAIQKNQKNQKKEGEE